MPGPKPLPTWERAAIVEWYDLEVEWWRIEAKKRVLTGFVYGMLVAGTVVGVIAIGIGVFGHG